jgi:octaprenyl-diphosphate synthase
LQNSPPKEARGILKLIKRGTNKSDVRQIIRFVTEHGGIDYAAKKAEDYRKEARKCLTTLPDSPAKESLVLFIDYVMKRSK